MRWLPKPKDNSWWIIAGVLSLIQFAAIIIGANLLLPHSDPKLVFIVLFCLATGLIIGGAGWLGARWLPVVATLGLIIGLFNMLHSFAGIDGWGDIIGLLSFGIFLFGGLLLGLVLEFVVWLYRTLSQK